MREASGGEVRLADLLVDYLWVLACWCPGTLMHRSLGAERGSVLGSGALGGLALGDRVERRSGRVLRADIRVAVPRGGARIRNGMVPGPLRACLVHTLSRADQGRADRPSVIVMGSE